jgi:hypothetical protein
MKSLINTSRTVLCEGMRTQKTARVSKALDIITEFDAVEFEELLFGMVDGFADTWDSVEDGGDTATATKCRNSLKALAVAWKGRSGN